ncbi:MAG: choice-of-anchor L domain-containing protein [Nannocystaceae bacterium]|nr:choice-of-anchor L domain-containing protein [Nannocystaceae bacterium]
MRRVGASILMLLAGCALEEREDPGLVDNGGGLTTPGTATDGGIDTLDATEEDDETGDIKLDVGEGGSGGPQECQEGQDCPDQCEAMAHVPCDAGTTDVFAAIGLGCEGEIQITGTTQGDPASIGIRTGFGATDTWAPREGSSFAVIGSGSVAELDSETPPNDPNSVGLTTGPTYCNDDMLASPDPGGTLPAPVRVTDVVGDCTTDETLLGSGDCSRTISGQFSQGGAAFDYAELRIIANVPEGNNSISYDFAFFSTEYPDYFGGVFNDMYVGWLESESWTGNISFDEQGAPISLNAGFLDFRDDSASLPEFGGTCMKQHAGTKWLSSTAPVTPGEQITVVLAVFDLADPVLDSYVFLDNWQWGCDGTGGPVTTPVG